MKIIFLFSLSLILLSCSPEIEKLQLKKWDKVQVVDKARDLKLKLITKADVLFVIDDSGSMRSHQENLSENIYQFASYFTRKKILDINIGVITSDMDTPEGRGKCGERQGRLFGQPRFVNNRTKNAVELLAENMLVGDNCSYTERFFDPVMAALSSPHIDNENKGFYREDALLAVIFITDAPDQSNVSIDDFKKFMLDLKGGDKDLLAAYGAIIPGNSQIRCPRDGVGSSSPILLEEAIRFFGGHYFNLCDPKFGKRLAGIGKALEDKLDLTFYLNEIPDLATIVVKYGDYLIPQDSEKGWTYDSFDNAIRLGWQLKVPDVNVKTDLEITFFPADKIRGE